MNVQNINTGLPVGVAILSDRDFKYTLSRAKRGERITYHRGYLFYDRLIFSDVNRVGNAAWSAYEDGLCVLIQERVRPNVCEYVAVRT